MSGLSGVFALNAMSNDEARAAFLSCCYCERWASDMNRARPYVSEVAIYAAASDCWRLASEPEKLEAFGGHPQIGDMDALRNKYAVSANREQGQIINADDVTLTELAELNQQYLADHGFIFIVCATGKSALEMLGLLKSRIDNTREQEIENAAREQGEITLLRIEKLLRQ